VAEFALGSGWASEVRELSEETVNWCVANDGLNAWDQRAGGLGWFEQRRDFFKKRLFRQSTRRAKCVRTYTPMMGRVTSATTNLHVKSRRRPQFRLRGILP
jgi:hypothetical protein